MEGNGRERKGDGVRGIEELCEEREMGKGEKEE